MATYTKTTWANGDIITATGLNNIESGVESGQNPVDLFLINVTRSSGAYTADKTFDDLKVAYAAGKTLAILTGNELITASVTETIGEPEELVSISFFGYVDLYPDSETACLLSQKVYSFYVENETEYFKVFKTTGTLTGTELSYTEAH